MTDWFAYEPCLTCGRSYRCVNMRRFLLMKPLKHPHKGRKRK